MMAPAMTTPRKMAGTAWRIRISSRAATNAPVQAPVPGSGMATRITRPGRRYFRTTRPFRWARRSRAVTFSPNSFVFRSHPKIRRISSKMKGTGTMFPAMAATQAAAGGSPAATPTGMAPRSSSTGTMAVRKVSSNSWNMVSRDIRHPPSVQTGRPGRRISARQAYDLVYSRFSRFFKK